MGEWVDGWMDGWVGVRVYAHDRTRVQASCLDGGVGWLLLACVSFTFTTKTDIYT